MPKTSTAKDVARLAGVSQATVSLVLNEHEGRFSDETRQRVQQAAAELGFLPSRAARALRLGRSDTIVLLVPDTPAGANGATATGVLADRIAALGYDLVIRRLRDGEPLSVLWEGLAPAAIIGTEVPTSRDIEAMRAAGVVPLFIDWRDVNYRIGALQVEHLAKRGHRTIGYVGPSDLRSRSFRAARVAGAVARCHELGLPTPVIEDIAVQPAAATGAVRRLRGAEVSGIAAYNDDDAFAVVFGARQLGLRVPDDLAVIGVDDLPLGALADPPLSTIRTREHGVIEAISSLRSDVRVAELGVDLTLIERESS